MAPSSSSSPSAPYELIYWAGLPGRGEFIRLLFEESSTSFIDHPQRDPKAAMSETADFISASHLGDALNPPFFAPPILRHGDLLINQMPNILLYLAPRLGLAPESGVAVYHLNEIALTIIDGLVNELHETHHPIGVSLYYEDQKAEALRRAKNFTSERLPRFMTYFQRLFDAETSGKGPWIYGESLTYVDLVLFQCIHGTEYAFPKTMKKLRESGKYKSVFENFEAVGNRPNVKAYMRSDRRMAYGDGIWRHYPEQEKDD